MVGRDVGDIFPKTDHELGETALEIRNLTVYSIDGNRRKLVDNVSFSVRKGEVLGIAGLMGSGRTETLMSIFGAAFAPAYGASKGGIVQLTKSLAVAWAADGIQVNAVLPGWVDTELTREARRTIAGLNERILARSPTDRWGSIEDFEGIAAFLASAESAFITGAAIPVDGGYGSLA